MSEKKLSKAFSGVQYVTNPLGLTGYNGLVRPGFGGDINYPSNNPLLNSVNILESPINYQQELAQCRFFYRRDPFASTVVNRMAEMTAGRLKHKRNYCNDEEYNFFTGLAPRLVGIIQSAALEYFVAGMAVPDYITSKIMGNKLHPKLGRKRYAVPDPIWLRNSDNIVLKRKPTSSERAVYIKIPPDERDFINNEGRYNDGTEDKELYALLVRQFPEYVRLVKEGNSIILLHNVNPILRKPMPNCDYPQPFLVPALSPLKHKMRIKEMDYTIATRAIEAIRLVQAGNDQYPVDEDDPTLKELRDQMIARSTVADQELVYTLYANHTVTIKWVYPPFDTLLSTDKFVAVDADIFMAMGFSRVLLIGESMRSNAGGKDLTVLGPLATLTEARLNIVEWLKDLYEDLAEQNGFTNIPEPIFDPLTVNDAQTLIQYASSALKDEVISRNTYAQLFGTDFDSEQLQRSSEHDAIINTTPDPTTAPTSNSPRQQQMIQDGVIPDPNANQQDNKPINAAFEE